MKEEEKHSLVGETVWEASYETIWARVFASQKMSRDSGRQCLPRVIKMSRKALWAEVELKSDSILSKSLCIKVPLREASKNPS